jgi:hypothetical protein
MLWLNMSLGLFFVLAICGIPLWMVIKYPDTPPDFSDARRLAELRARSASIDGGHDQAA